MKMSYRSKRPCTAARGDEDQSQKKSSSQTSSLNPASTIDATLLPTPPPKIAAPTPPFKNPGLTPPLKNPAPIPPLKSPAPTPPLKNPAPIPSLKRPALTPSLDIPAPTPPLENPTSQSQPSSNLAKKWGLFSPPIIGTSKPTVLSTRTTKKASSSGASHQHSTRNFSQSFIPLSSKSLPSQPESSGTPLLHRKGPVTRASQSSMLHSNSTVITSGSHLLASQLPPTSLQSDRGVSPTGVTKSIHRQSSATTSVGFKSQSTVHTFSEPMARVERQESPTMHVLEEPIEGHREQSPIFDSVSERTQDVPREPSPSQPSDKVNVGGSKVKKPRLMKPQRVAVPVWSNSVKFDEDEEVVTIDAEGKHELVRGSVLPRHVWNDKEGVRYEVHFNKYNQPIRKGASILISFLGDIAKKERFCPIGLTSWHKLHKKYKAEIIRIVRGHFIIPPGEIFDKGILMRVGNNWKQHKHIIKKNYDPDQSLEENYEAVPDGVTSDSWIRLVDYWDSEYGRKLSQNGKDARASQTHVHTSGATSFANRRADFEKKNGREPSELEFFKSTHARADGSFVDGTLSAKFVEHADSKVEETLTDPSSKSRVAVENKVFEDLMYEGEVPKRPVNYGFGVKQSDIFGVQGELRKSAYNYAGNSSIEVEHLKVKLTSVLRQNEEVLRQNDNLTKQSQEMGIKFEQMFKTVSMQMVQVLKAVRSGKASDELLDGALHMIHSQAQDSSIGFRAEDPSSSGTPSPV